MKNKIKITDHHLAPIYRGNTDIAAFTLMICHDGGKIDYAKINFSEDGSNKVYIADNTKENIAIPEYYEERADVAFYGVFWFAIYDDEHRIFKSENYHGKADLGLFEKGRSAIVLIEPIEDEEEETGTVYVCYLRDGKILGEYVEFGGENPCKEELIAEMQETPSVLEIYKSCSNCGPYGLIWKRED